MSAEADEKSSPPRSRMRLPNPNFNSRGWGVFSAVASLVTIIAFIIDPFEGVLTATWSRIAALIIFLFILVFVLFAVRSASKGFAERLLLDVERRQQQTLEGLQERYFAAITEQAERLLPLQRTQDALAQLAEISVHLKKIELAVDRDPANAHDIARSHLLDSLKTTSNLFERLSGSTCRLCIKLEYTPANEVQRAVYAIARSNTIVPDSRPPDYVYQNTDFANIAIRGDDFWFCGDIQALEPGTYSNTSAVIPYKSVIVWPIRAFDQPVTQPVETVHSGSRVIGYLCLDTLERNAFSPERELRIGWWYVDVLAVVLNSLIETGKLQVKRG